MNQSSVARFAVWLAAALIAWTASTWASGESLNWYQPVVQILGHLLPPVYRRVGLPEDIPTARPDTTAVILNWSRFPNVLQISSLLCSPALDGIIAQVFIWNNNPNPISLDDFASTGCPDAKLRIHNSAENMYFHARFVACSQAATPFCFIQDDDYLVHAEVIQALHAKLSQATGEPRAIHLLPSHEHLATTLRTIRAGPAHTSFAWLGHGALLPRSAAADFLALLRALAASGDELQMADNYFAILSNRVAEVWFDQGLELGGGQPFTVGAEGLARNSHHIRRAAEYLEIILGSNADGTSAQAQLPYVSTREHGPDELETSLARAACRLARCLLETNIRLLPQDLEEEARGPRHMLEAEADRRAVLSDQTVELYLEHSPSRAVDDRAATYFESSENAAAGDYVLLDYFEDIYARNWTSVRMVLVVDGATRDILEQSDLTVSGDGLTWNAVEQTFGCGDSKTNVWRCHAEWTPKEGAGMRSVRVLLGESQHTPWKIYEMYLSGRR
ncbi:hypothetical protein PHLGIDRAFT_205414 [Phlebiopsis gigantea 11061_1 CR5-6]|uniref:F5/8 type C domain-containing protein n=1 Tax=Phlebiopsis gigantea (strain 11061_1 CR5-6) TaxID=745531 RepID=A0A0C3S315_PHLG1|nr:hypothetical protein PHLGIDRAFT_205414 [Phlebiopsis gigantea 11061_1 CR5-6]